MLEESVFKQQFERVAAHYSYKLTPPIARLYYKHLSENLTEEEFMQALEKVVIQFPPRMGLPSPQEIVEIIAGSKQALALQEWQLIVKAASRNRPEDLEYLSNRAHIALSAIGGFDAVGYEEGTLKWLQKSFTQVYCECSGDDKILKQAPVINPRTPPPDDEDLITPEQWTEAKARLKKLGIWKSNR